MDDTFVPLCAFEMFVHTYDVFIFLRRSFLTSPGQFAAFQEYMQCKEKECESSVLLHEDLRQDERVIQSSGLVNAHLARERRTNNHDLNI